MLRPHGGYRQLRSFQVAEVIYDATVAFCDRFIDKRSRTHDQMVQAARSGRQNSPREVAHPVHLAKPNCVSSASPAQASTSYSWTTKTSCAKNS
jgi:hypothetical protein